MDVSKIRPRGRATWDDEEANFAEISAAFAKMGEQVRENEGRTVPVSQAKSTGVLKNRLPVDKGVHAVLAHGLFAWPSGYEVFVRLAQEAGETRGHELSTHARMAVKIMGAGSERIPKEGNAQRRTS